MYADDRSAYPHPDDFKVMRPEYTGLTPDVEDDENHQEWQATIIVAPFKVVGQSTSKAGARRAALYEAEREYRNYHPSYRIVNPFPDEFVDTEGTAWKRVKAGQRATLGDYSFILEGDDEEDYANIEQMLNWDVRLRTDD